MTLELCVLLWPADGKEHSLAQYEDTVLALVPKYGGRVASRVRRTEEGTGPLEVQVIHFPDRSALSAYMADPERLALSDVRRDVVARTELLTVETIV